MGPTDEVEITLFSSESFAVPPWMSFVSFILLVVGFIFAAIWCKRDRNARALLLAFACVFYAAARLPEFLSSIPIARHSFLASQIAVFTSRFGSWSDLVATVLFVGYILSRWYESFHRRIDSR
jgi:signal transduction histidine kinase